MKWVVGLEGFEPTTRWLHVPPLLPLSYRPTAKLYTKNKEGIQEMEPEGMLSRRNKQRDELRCLKRYKLCFSKRGYDG